MLWTHRIYQQGVSYCIYNIISFSGTRNAIFRIMEKYDREWGHSVPNHVDI